MPENNGDKVITVHVPINLRTWGGKKVIVAPAGQDLRTFNKENRKDKKLLKAIGRAYKWQTWLHTGKYISVEEIADAENINRSYISRILRLMKLSPSIIQSTLDGNQPDEFGLSSVEKPFPILWAEQEELFKFKSI